MAKTKTVAKKPAKPSAKKPLAKKPAAKAPTHQWKTLGVTTPDPEPGRSQLQEKIVWCGRCGTIRRSDALDVSQGVQFLHPTSVGAREVVHVPDCVG